MLNPVHLMMIMMIIIICYKKKKTWHFQHFQVNIGCDNLLETVGGGRWSEQSLRLAVSGPVQRV